VKQNGGAPLVDTMTVQEVYHLQCKLSDVQEQVYHLSKHLHMVEKKNAQLKKLLVILAV